MIKIKPTKLYLGNERMYEINDYSIVGTNKQFNSYTKTELLSFARKIIKKLGSKEWCENCHADLIDNML